MRARHAASLRWDWTPLVLLPWLLCLALAVYLLFEFGRGKPTEAEPGATGSGAIPAQLPLSIHLIAPVALSHFRAQNGTNAPVRFTWEIESRDARTGNPSEPLFLELSANSNFTREATTIWPVNGARSTEVTRALPPGHYFWRLRAGKFHLSETRELWVENETLELSLETPQRGQDFSSGAEGAGILFSWKGADLSQYPDHVYQLELSKRSSFDGRVLTQKTRRNSIREKGTSLAPGKYYWRVRLLDADGAVRSETEASWFSFHPKPTLLAPRSKIHVDLKAEPRR